MTSNVTSRARRTSHEHDIEVSTNIEHAKRLDAMNGNVLWRHGTESWMPLKHLKEDIWYRVLDTIERLERV